MTITNMGNAKIRRLIKEQRKWTEHTAPIHKHDFSKQVIVCVKSADGFVGYYTGTCCLYCHSFDDAVFTTEPDKSMPMLTYKTSHNFRIGFSDLVFVEERN